MGDNVISCAGSHLRAVSTPHKDLKILQNLLNDRSHDELLRILSFCVYNPNQLDLDFLSNNFQSEVYMLFKVNFWVLYYNFGYSNMKQIKYEWVPLLESAHIRDFSEFRVEHDLSLLQSHGWYHQGTNRKSQLLTLGCGVHRLHAWNGHQFCGAAVAGEERRMRTPDELSLVAVTTGVVLDDQRVRDSYLVLGLDAWLYYWHAAKKYVDTSDAMFQPANLQRIYISSWARFVNNCE